ncbi:MAG: hypothetical protein WCF04_05845 [Candidatus Nanopelagicales bacterium]
MEAIAWGFLAVTAVWVGLVALAIGPGSTVAETAPRSTAAETAKWRTGATVAPAEVQDQAAAAARKAAGWRRSGVSDYLVRTSLTKACTAMYEGAPASRRDRIVRRYLTEQDVRSSVRDGVPEAVAAGVAIQCPDA